MKKPKKKSKKPLKKVVKKRGSEKPDPSTDPGSGTKKPDPSGKIDLPTPKNLPKTPPRAPGKKNKGGRPKKKALVPAEIVKKGELPPDPPPDPPPDDEQERPKTPEEIAARSGARLLAGLERSACDSEFLAPPMSSEHHQLLEETWYEYLLSIGGEIPPWLGLGISHAVVFGPRVAGGLRRRKAARK